MKRAFTLIELLVVIAIISLLMSILLPSLNAARDRARAVNCLSNLKQLSMSLMFYANDHNQVVPFFVNNQPWSMYYFANNWGGPQPLYPMPFKSGFCPSNMRLPVKFVSNTGLYGMLHLIGDGNGSKFNANRFGAFVVGSWGTPKWEVFDYRKMSEPATTGLMFDSVVTSGSSLGYGNYFVTNNKLTWGGSPAVFLPHANACNVAFADGHAAPAKKKELGDMPGQMDLAAVDLTYQWVK